MKRDIADGLRIIEILKTYDKFSLNVAVGFYNKHNIQDFEQRIRYEYSANFGNYRVLRYLLVNNCQSNMKDFVNTYEGLYDDLDVPHYESAIILTTLILSAIAMIGTFLSPIIGVEYKEWKERAKTDQKYIMGDFRNHIIKLYEYFTLAYILRDVYYSGIIDLKEFKGLLKTIKQNRKESLNKVKSILNESNINLSLPKSDDLLKELDRIAKSELVKISVSSSSNSNFQNKDNSDAIIGVSSGNIRGTIKMISSIKDAYKINNGDIAFFEFFNPDMIPVVKKCSGAIGSTHCGGRLGHLGIVCRELGIPCVIKVSPKDYNLKDGKILYLDGSRGVIKIIT